MGAPAVNEFALIHRFLEAFPRLPSPQGPGDDCAVLAPTRHALCVTTDALFEGVHFTRATFSLEDVGHKALAVNLSDLAAMGARPAWAVCALGLPSDITARHVSSLARGMARLARAHQVALVGGNVSAAGELSVTMTLGGHVAPGHALLRSGARPHDALYVSGPLGLASGGLELLRTKRRPAGAARLINAQRRPAPHVAVGLALVGQVSACIDVSDGLVQDLGHLCEQSRVGAELISRALPIPRELDACFGERALHLALTGGEDYVLLFTVPRAAQPRFERRMAARGFAVHCIGRITARPEILVDGKRLRGPGGFSHFR